MIAEHVPIWASLRLRLLLGAGLIAAVAVAAALLAGLGIAEAARMIERSASAQQRIDLLSGLSARVSDYALVAVETAGPDVPAEARRARLTSASARVTDAFSQMDRAVGAFVAEAQDAAEAEQMRRATQSLGLARMRAQYSALERNIDAAQDGGGLRAHLDGFATQFSPLINAAINEAQRDRATARRAVTELRDKMVGTALAAAAVAAVLVVLFYLVLVRPLLGQVARVRTAAQGIGTGQFNPGLPEGEQSELGYLMAEVNRMAALLQARQAHVDADRAELNQIITDRTAELEEANTRLSQIDTDRRRFFADVGHELRTPLTVILAESELARDAQVDAVDAKESLSVIHARAARLNRRIDDLLRVARSETGQIELDAAPFDLADAANAALADMSPLAKRRGVALVSDLIEAPAHGDRDWCRQVISGLIENALKKSAEGGIVEVSTRSNGTRALAEVLDEGEGLPDGEADRVFTRFARGTRESAGSGFGVGLALARWVVERQSGSIALQSPAPRAPRGGSIGGRGVQVSIALPMTAEEVQTGSTGHD
ncbi:MAG: HAMP domain-containing sensor histidine kinase [Pseudomonadota bacterium]